MFGYGEKWRRSQSLSAESSGIYRHHLVAGGGDLVGGHAGIVQRKLCQRGKICRVHLVQLRKVCGDAHPCTELMTNWITAGAAVSGVKVSCRPMAAAMVMNRSRHTGLRLLKAST